MKVVAAAGFAETAETAPTGDSDGRRRHTVLLVDDEVNVLSALRRLLRADGYRIEMANGGAEALKIMEQTPVDLVISDMRMPHMSGAEFLSEVARRWPETMRLLLTGYSDLESTVAAINQGHIYRYIGKPWEEAELKGAIYSALEHKSLREERERLLALTERQNAELRDLNANLESKVEARTEETRQTALFLETAYAELKNAYRASIPVFARLVELREGTTAGHGRRIAELALATAQELGADEELLEAVEDAALLHDIGKIGLDDAVLRTPYTELSSSQRELEHQHGVVGEALLMGLKPLAPAAAFIRAHHERFDGKGYPDGLRGEEIPLGARLLAVASDFDAALSGQIFAESMVWDEARAFIEQHSGSRYDPTVTAAFLSVVDQYKSRQGLVSELKLTSMDLRAGLVLSRDLEARQGMLLLAAGHVLEDSLIERIRRYERDMGRSFTIYVQAPEEQNHAQNIVG